MSLADKRKPAEPITVDVLPGKRQRVIGPALPSSHELHTDNDSTAEDGSSDEDDIGPVLPPDGSAPGPDVSTSGKSIPIGTGISSLAKQPSPVAGPQRDDWMLQPPESMDWASRVDPTKIKNRKFQTGRSASSRSEGKADSSWTETPEQKMKRLQDQVMGVSSHKPAGDRQHQSAISSEAIRGKLHRYRETKAAEEVADDHQSQPRRRQTGEDDDDPSSREFDREKDMSLSSKLTSSQRRDVIGKAADFSSRFTSGKFL